jgi:hypothetical protein
MIKAAPATGPGRRPIPREIADRPSSPVRISAWHSGRNGDVRLRRRSSCERSGWPCVVLKIWGGARVRGQPADGTGDDPARPAGTCSTAPAEVSRVVLDDAKRAKSAAAPHGPARRAVPAPRVAASSGLPDRSLPCRASSERGASNSERDGVAVYQPAEAPGCRHWHVAIGRGQHGAQRLTAQGVTSRLDDRTRR